MLPPLCSLLGLGKADATLVQLAAMYGNEEGGLDPNRHGFKSRLLGLGYADATLMQLAATYGDDEGGLDPNRRGPNPEVIGV